MSDKKSALLSDEELKEIADEGIKKAKELEDWMKTLAIDVPSMMMAVEEYNRIGDSEARFYNLYATYLDIFRRKKEWQVKTK